MGSQRGRLDAVEDEAQRLYDQADSQDDKDLVRQKGRRARLIEDESCVGG